MDPLLEIKILHNIIYTIYNNLYINKNISFYILHTGVNKIILEGDIKFDDSINSKKWNKLYSVIVSNIKVSNTIIDALLKVNYIWNPDTMDLFIFEINVKNFLNIHLSMDNVDDLDNIYDYTYLSDTLEELFEDVRRQKDLKLITIREQYADYRYVTFKQALEWLSPNLLLVSKEELVKIESRLREMITKESILIEKDNELILDLYYRNSIDSKFMTRIFLEFCEKMTPEEALNFISKQI